MDRNKSRAIQARVMAVIKPLEAELGIKFTDQGGRYSDIETIFKIKAADAVNADGKAINPDKVEFESLAPMYGLNASDFGKTFTHGNITAKIVGIKPRRSKYPIVGEDIKTGKKYVFSEVIVKLFLKGKDGTPPQRSPEKIIERLREIECALSPENLSCDGELPASQTRARRIKLETEQRALHLELGREPSFAELYPKLGK